MDNLTTQKGLNIAIRGWESSPQNDKTSVNLPDAQKEMTEQITVHDKTFQIYLKESDIYEKIDAVANVLNKRNPDNCPVFLVILKGAFLFATELLKRYEGACEVEFVRVSSYKGTESSGKVKVENLNRDLLTDRDVIIIEDIIDSGRTMHHFMPVLEACGPKSIQIYSLLFKPDALQHPLEISHYAFEIPNDFVVGFGLDYDGLGRNLRSIYQLSE